MNRNTISVRFTGLLFLAMSWTLASPEGGRCQAPGDQLHVSLTLGGYVLLGVGYTHWMREHHALEATVFPLSWPAEGFPFGLRVGHAWIPSNEAWRAKLGSNLTFLVRSAGREGRRFTPLLAFTPGLQYDPVKSRSVRLDLWMSYYLTEHVFAPTGLEVLHAFPR